jgi:hypothetical protein
VLGIRGRNTVDTTAGSRARMRERAPGKVKIDSKTFEVTDISESGVVIDDYTGDLVARQRVYFDLILPVGGEKEKEEAFRCEAAIVKLEKGRMVAKFLDLRNDARRVIRHIVAHRNAVITSAPMPRAG